MCRVGVRNTVPRFRIFLRSSIVKRQNYTECDIVHRVCLAFLTFVQKVKKTKKKLEAFILIIFFTYFFALLLHVKLNLFPSCFAHSEMD
jgi:hypothetical protein